MKTKPTPPPATGQDRKALRRSKTHQSGTPYGAPMAFIDQAVASATDECIPWPYGLSDNGYGKVPIGVVTPHCSSNVFMLGLGTIT
mgnify:CR=1 FL=1